MRLYRKTTFAAVASIVVLWAVSASQAQAECLSWDSARHVIKQNGLVPAGAVRQRLKSRSGRLLEFRLCRVGGHYVYKVVTQRPGQVSKMIVDARSGRRMGRTGGGPIAAGASRLPKLPKMPKLFRGRKKRGY